MATLYLYLNAAIYVVFSLWCSFAATGTARSLGFTAMTRSGEAEYLTVYGGLQMGLAIIFGGLAWIGEIRTGLFIALALYAPLVLWRIVGVSLHWPVANTTLYVAALEASMLIVAALLWLSHSGSR